MRMRGALTNELAGMAPEADLRTIAIGRRGNIARLTDLKPALARPPTAEDLFFTKGSASAEAFEPAFLRPGDALETVVVELRVGDISRAAGPEDAQASRTGIGVLGGAGGNDELLELERAFLEYHRLALIEGAEPEPDHDDPTQQETPSATPGRLDACAPLADLRTLELRPTVRDAALVAAERALAPPSAAETGESATAEEEERPTDAAPGASPPMTSGERRETSLTPLQIAIIVFGCVAVLASAGVFFPVHAPPPPRAAIAAPPPQAAAPAARPLSPAVEDLLSRGDERLRSGDVSAARLFYQKAADAGSARGALMMGATYDPHFLATIGVYGMPGDEKAAAIWYGRAGDLGDSGAANLAKTFRRQ
jgi:hypothetical protein